MERNPVSKGEKYRLTPSSLYKWKEIFNDEKNHADSSSCSICIFNNEGIQKKENNAPTQTTEQTTQDTASQDTTQAEETTKGEETKGDRSAWKKSTQL